jgi:hypothetical protein
MSLATAEARQRAARSRREPWLAGWSALSGKTVTMSADTAILVASRLATSARVVARGAGILSIAFAVGCAVDGSGDPVGHTSQPLLGICAPLTCCFPSGGGWSENPFEDGLRALGCDVPQAYSPSYGQSDWWLYSACPASVQLTTLVLHYALVSPYYSQIVVNECLELQAVGRAQPTRVFVEWDPTCSSCYSGYFYSYPLIFESPAASTDPSATSTQ